MLLKLKYGTILSLIQLNNKDVSQENKTRQKKNDFIFEFGMKKSARILIIINITKMKIALDTSGIQIYLDKSSKIRC